MNPKLISISKKTLPYLFPVIVLAAAAIYLLNNLDQFKQIKISSWWWLAALFIGCFSQSVFAALVFKKLLDIFQVRLGYLEALGLVYVTGMGNYFVPYVGGMSLRAAYLKKRYGFSLGYFASTVGGAALLSISINALIGLLVLLYLLATRGVFNLIIFLVFLFCLILPVILIFLPARKFNTKNRLLQKIGEVWQGWKYISRQPADVAALAMLIFLTAAAGVLILYFSFRIVSEPIPFPDAVIISAMTSLSALVNLTPSGLGISELVLVFTSRVLGYMIAVGISAALVRRVISSILLFAGGGISSWLLSRAIVKNEGKKGAKEKVVKISSVSASGKSIHLPGGPLSSG